jgi:hypothetical protein
MYTVGDIAKRSRRPDVGPIGWMYAADRLTDRDVNVGDLDAPKASDLDEHGGRWDNLRAWNFGSWSPSSPLSRRANSLVRPVDCSCRHPL